MQLSMNLGCFYFNRGDWPSRRARFADWPSRRARFAPKPGAITLLGKIFARLRISVW